MQCVNIEIFSIFFFKLLENALANRKDKKIWEIYQFFFLISKLKGLEF